MEALLKIILTFILSFILEVEREIRKKPAGLRTHFPVGIGSTIFTIFSYKYFPGADPTHIAANIITGIGFIGADTILKEEERIIGLITAASLWLTASIGMAVGVGAYDLAITGTFIGAISLF